MLGSDKVPTLYTCALREEKQSVAWADLSVEKAVLSVVMISSESVEHDVVISNNKKGSNSSFFILGCY